MVCLPSTRTYTLLHQTPKNMDQQRACRPYIAKKGVNKAKEPMFVAKLAINRNQDPKNLLLARKRLSTLTKTYSCYAEFIK